MSALCKEQKPAAQLTPAASEPSTSDARLRIALLGAPIGIGNRGVSALGASLVGLIREVQPDVEICLLMGHSRPETRRLQVRGAMLDIRVINYRLSPKARLGEQLWWIVLLSLLYRLIPSRRVRAKLRAWSPWVRCVAEVDMVGDIRGGDSFSDIYGLHRFLLGSLALLSVIWIRGRVALFPQTYGPYRSRMSRGVARYILKRADPILARDTESQAVVAELTRNRRSARLCPDVAFSLEAIRPPSPLVEPALPDGGAPFVLVGLNVNGLMMNGGYNRDNMFGLALDYPAFLRTLLPALLALKAVHVLLVPHTFAPPDSVESDDEASRILAAQIAHPRLHRVTHAYDQYEIKGIIGMCDFFIGSRMHSCIAALSQGIPTVGVAYSRKFSGVFSTVGMEDWVVDGRTLDAARGVEAVLERFSRRLNVRENLARSVSNANATLRKEFGALCNPAVGSLKSVGRINPGAIPE